MNHIIKYRQTTEIPFIKIIYRVSGEILRSSIKKKEKFLHTDRADMIKEDIRALRKPNFPSVIVTSAIKLRECKVISSKPIAMGTVL